MSKLPSPAELALWHDMHPDWTTVGETAEAAGIAQSTASERLTALYQAGFLQKSAHGKKRYYKPKPKVLLVRGGWSA